MAALARVLRTSLLLAASSPVCWATTWIVDDDGGAGVDFTDLPPAVAAAQPGDTILVHEVSYSGAIVQEGITIIGLHDQVESELRI